MNSRPYQQCTRCVMDTTDPEIYFKDDGTCNHCNENLAHLRLSNLLPAKSEFEFEKFAKTIKAKNKLSKYDCVIGLSGGVDSCYTTHLAKKYGLNALLIHLDNGWNTVDAQKNIEFMSKKFDFDLKIITLDQEEYREVQLAFLRSGVLDFELAFDIAIPAVLHNEAKRNGIKSILSGGNYASEGILPLEWGYHPLKDGYYYRQIISRFCKIRPKKIPTFGLWKEIYMKMILGIKTYYPLNLINYDKDQSRQYLETEYEIKFPSNKHHESRFTRFWQTVIVPKKFGIDYRLATLSSQICSNHKTRDEAIKILSAKPELEFKLEEEKSYLCSNLNISMQEFDALLNTTPTTYHNYPNSKHLILFTHRVYRLIFKKG